jgi:hypothetical protein
MYQTDGSRVWPICALFLIFSKSVPSVSAPAAYISLSQLLREANLRYVIYLFGLCRSYLDLFEALPGFWVVFLARFSLFSRPMRSLLNLVR